jgi:hypothetical protein
MFVKLLYDCPINRGLNHCDYLLHTKINEIKQPNKTVTIFPNPTKDILSIRLLKPDMKVNSMQIIDMQGKVLKVFNQNELNISSLSKGIYLIKIDFDNNESVIERIIKE